MAEEAVLQVLAAVLLVLEAVLRAAATERRQIDLHGEGAYVEPGPIEKEEQTKLLLNYTIPLPLLEVAVEASVSAATVVTREVAVAAALKTDAEGVDLELGLGPWLLLLALHYT